MSVHPFEQTVNQAKRRLDVAAALLDHVQHSFAQNDRKAAYQAAFELAYQTEKLTMLARTLPALTGSPIGYAQMGQLIRKAVPIRVGYSKQGWLGIYMPALLPKKERGGADYIRDSLYPALRDFFRKGEHPLLPDCVLTVCHLYDRRRPERQYRDHDNIELNAVVDSLALFALPDDVPMRCQHHYCSAASNQDATQILLVPKDEFSTWYNCWTQEPGEPFLLFQSPQ